MVTTVACCGFCQLLLMLFVYILYYGSSNDLIPDIGDVSRDVEFCSRVKVLFSAGYRGAQSLVLQPGKRHSEGQHSIPLSDW